MNEHPSPAAEEVADALFEQLDALPSEPPDPGPPLPVKPPSGTELPTALPPAPSPQSPLHDYVREIQQEFQEQESAGKF